MSRAKRKQSPTGDEPKHRWECPAGHKSWERTNSHIWCHGCAREVSHNPDADPEWYELLDTASGEIVPFEELKQEWPDFSEINAY